jgi:2-oxoglutarate dehydrogenase E1 component
MSVQIRCLGTRRFTSWTMGRSSYHGRFKDSMNRVVAPRATTVLNNSKRVFSSAQLEYHENESFLSGSNSVYVEQMYENYKMDPNSVHKSWRSYFENIQNGKPYRESDYSAPTVACSTAIGARSSTNTGVEVPTDSLGVAHLIRAYQVNGHTAAKLDPLNVYSKEAFPFRPCNVMDLSNTDNNYPPDLCVEYHGFRADELDRYMNLKGTSSGGAKGYLDELAKSPEKVTLRMILHELRKTYTGTLGVEYMHIGSVDKCNWIRERVENPRWLRYDKEKKQHIFERLCFADTFENFLANKFNTTKRFGLDGGEAVVPGLKDAIDRASELGAHSFVIGMPHRGRLNVLANVLRKPMPLIFSEFQGTHFEIKDHDKSKKNKSDDYLGFSGDVKCKLLLLVWHFSVWWQFGNSL